MLPSFRRLASPFLRQCVASHAQQLRNINLHEFQSKALMDNNKVRVQKFKVASSADEATKLAKEMKDSGVKELVLKAQVHAGGRGKGHFPDSGLQGGVHLTEDHEEIGRLTEKMIGYNLVTKQTPPEGARVDKVLIAESLNFEKEYYFAILMDRAFQGPVLVASPQGGMDIEAVAEETPHLIFKEPINILKGIQDDQAIALANKLGIKNVESAVDQMKALYNMFLSIDATQVEINPLVEATDGQVYAVDAKINLDESSEYRQKELFAMADESDKDPREVAAHKVGLNYIGMDGNIGCMVNGAGLAMATMDIIKLYKGEPANFLDAGGGANEAQVTEAFKIIQGDPRVKALLVNIFGGIVDCNIIAEGIVSAVNQVGLRMPLVVRLEGTNATKAKETLQNSKMDIVTATDLDDAAQKATAAIGL